MNNEINFDTRNNKGNPFVLEIGEKTTKRLFCARRTMFWLGECLIHTEKKYYNKNIIIIIPVAVDNNVL